VPVPMAAVPGAVPVLAAPTVPFPGIGKGARVGEATISVFTETDFAPEPDPEPVPDPVPASPPVGAGI